MSAKSNKPYFVVIGLMVATSLALAYTVDVTIMDEAGVRTEFPASLGEWKGDPILFCQNPKCRSDFIVSQLDQTETCPKCDAELHTMAIAERALLPPDTVLRKMRYESPDGQIVNTAIVLSGSERASIHRPEKCLRGGGTEITGDEVVDVPLPNGNILKVKILHLVRHVRVAEDREIALYSYYAYWFSGNQRETPYHTERIIRMATDRIFFNRAHRWAYISVAAMKNPDGPDYKDQVRNFVRELYPQISLSYTQGDS